MVAAHVTGLIARLMQEYELLSNKKLNRDSTLDLIRKSATDFLPVAKNVKNQATTQEMRKAPDKWMPVLNYGEAIESIHIENNGLFRIYFSDALKKFRESEKLESEKAENFQEESLISPNKKEENLKNLPEEISANSFLEEKISENSFLNNLSQLDAKKNKLEPDAVVVRGGACKFNQRSINYSVNEKNQIEGLSVNVSLKGETWQKLAALLPNNQVGLTTVKEIIKKGGRIQYRPSQSNPYHAEISGLTIEQLQELFNVRKNPDPRRLYRYY
jgi:hypothetical protein